jgi:hypothetical protein
VAVSRQGVKAVLFTLSYHKKISGIPDKNGNKEDKA